MEELKAQRPAMELKVKVHRERVDQSTGLWEEIRTANLHPSRRSYHSAVAYKGKMLIYGGQDLREGPQSGLWSIPVSRYDQGEWEEIHIRDYGPICRHSAIIKDSRMYVFGGSDGSQEFNRIITINLENLSCELVLPESPVCPPPLDSHTACLYEEGSESNMIVFGGFATGKRSNSVYSYNLISKKWRKIETSSGPESRSNHSAVIYKDHLYIFGGTSEEGEKLSDLWKLDLKSNLWVELNAEGDIPLGRSGHSAVLYHDVMIVFGGIKDITKETNDMHSYDFETNHWVLFQFEHQIKDPVSNEQLEEFKKTRTSTAKAKHDPSPLIKKPPESASLQKRVNEGGSPETVTPSIQKKKKTLYEGPTSPSIGRLSAHPPHPRDGHSAVIMDNVMVVFGGDRHQMPFNDTYVYTLVEQTIKTPVSLS